MKKTLLLSMLIAASLACSLSGKAATMPITVTSPSEQLSATVTIESQALRFAVRHGSTQLLAPSAISMETKELGILGQGIKKQPKVSRYSRTIKRETPFYRKASINMPCNGMTLNFGKYSMEVVAFDAGVAYRFTTRSKDSLTVVNETGDFTLPADYKVYQTAVNSNSTKIQEQFLNSFERQYDYDNVSKLSTGRLGQGPLLAELPEGKKLLITDYDNEDYPGMYLLPTGSTTLKAVYSPCPKTEVPAGYNSLQTMAGEFEPYIARTAGTRTFPWKIFVVTTSDAQLIDCDVPCALAPASRIADASWVKPGLAQWDWWHAWNIKGVNFRAGINNETYKYYIDYASRNGIPYVVLDDGWSEPADLMKLKNVDLQELIAYGQQRGVSLVLWAMGLPFYNDMEAICKHYSAMGIKGFKIDFFDRNDQLMVRRVQQIAATCAKYKLFVDLHGIFPPNGLNWQYPNVLNFEAVAGEEQVKWSDKSFDMVRHETLLPFIRTVVGPMDFTQGAMRNVQMANYYPCNSKPMSQGTRCRQLADYVLFDAPFGMMCDAPTSYEANQPCADFIASTPTVWDEIRVLDAKVGEYIVEARRKGNVWHLGGITNWTARDLNVDLNFLAGKRMKLYQDGINADRDAEDYKIVEQSVPATLQVHLAPGGGFAAIIQ